MSPPHMPLSADPAAFPVRPPADLSDPAVLAAHDQAAFDAVETMVDHWARPGWALGTRAYYWLLAFPGNPELAALAKQCQHALSPLGLDPVPDDGLHITLARIGSPAALSPARLNELISTTAPLLPPAFPLRAIPLAGSRGAVRLSVTPWAQLVALHAVLNDAMQAFGLPPRKATALFRPHLSLAYNNKPRPAAPVIKTVTGLRGCPPVELQVHEVQLVELRREERAYRWDVIKSLPLG
ncbi:2'-5' RNA ligase family protein [Streptomyces sp. AK02-01A]|uniref:2'-5' RNA ligase family protein n=1 Tax=Streptomyces sp. AK02-01A TaxID=3028648 RepID=UPI0029A46C34|nr:2'-5' RNA ligase family protein [Streptomyces sp. AK02-01A]MDX3854212.1 2'-5' RNA ligase family protein [Streptomyces sp. AK02-01A]